MSDEQYVNFDVAEKYSYVNVSGRCAKLGASVTGDAELLNPLCWSYAETHSYVRVSPSSLSIEVPSGVDEVYAKVMYLTPHTHSASDIEGLSDSVSDVSESIRELSSSLTDDFHEALISAIHDHLSDIDALSDVINDIIFEELTGVKANLSSVAGIVDESSEAIDENSEAIESLLSSNNSRVEDISYLSGSVDGNAATISGLSDRVDSLSNALDECSGKADANSETISSLLSSVDGNSTQIESLSDTVAENYAEMSLVSSQLSESISSLFIPSKNSEIENDTQYVALSTVQQMMAEMANSFNQKIVRLEAKDEDTTVDLGEHSDSLDNLNVDERNYSDTLDNGIVFGDRV